MKITVCSADSEIFEGKTVCGNCYRITSRYVEIDGDASESDRNIQNFKGFIEFVRSEADRGDTSPVYVLDFFERLDYAVDVEPFIDMLASVGRQVFVGVGRGYPMIRFENNNIVQIA